MSVSNGKRYAAEPACRVIKAEGLYVRIASSGAVTGALWSHCLFAVDWRSRAVTFTLVEILLQIFFVKSFYSIKCNFIMSSIGCTFTQSFL